MKALFDWNEITSLIQILRSKGICYIIGNDSSFEKEREIDTVYLLQRMAVCGYPLVENACISLFILHPDLVPTVISVLQSSEPDVIEHISVMTLATLYLQQWWFFRLTFALGQIPSFPDAPFAPLWEERHLPPPTSSYGIDGLLALQEYQQQRYGIPLNFLDDWQNQVAHLLQQEEAHHRQLSEVLKRTLLQVSI